MGETQTTEEAKPVQPKEPALTFSMPDPDQWTIEHYIMYSEGRKKAGENMPEIIKRYFGSLELIARGVVHVKGPERLLAALKVDEQKITSLPLVGTVAFAVGNSIESAFYLDPNS